MRGLALLAVVVPLAAQAQAPFCAVTSMGAQCHYWSVDACYQALRGVGGQCVANPAALPQSTPGPAAPSPLPTPPQISGPNVFESFQRGAALGRAMRQPQPYSPPSEVVYACQSASDGTWYRTTQPEVGCVVAEVR